jgi:hypothetical protein
MKVNIRIVLSLIALTLLVLFAVFVWPTMYRYDRFLKTVVRTNRFTGNTEQLSE